MVMLTHGLWWCFSSRHTVKLVRVGGKMHETNYSTCKSHKNAFSVCKRPDLGQRLTFQQDYNSQHINSSTQHKIGSKEKTECVRMARVGLNRTLKCDKTYCSLTNLSQLVQFLLRKIDQISGFQDISQKS